MTGEKKFKTIMDMLLDDEMYYKLYTLIERANGFFDKGQTISFNDFNDEYGGTQLDVNQSRFYFGKYRNDSYIAIVYEDVFGLHNAIYPNEAYLYSNPSSTDICPYNDLNKDNNYEFGWFLTGHVITDEVECDLFQQSTVNGVYSLYELQEIINRARNLPIKEKYKLHLKRDLLEPMFYEKIDKLLQGY